MISSASEILSSVRLRENALKLSVNEFETKYNKANEQIALIRERREVEYIKISAAAERTYESIKPLADKFWDALEEIARKTIDDELLTSNLIKKDKNEATQKRIMEKISVVVQNNAQIFTERIQNRITAALCDEVGDLQSFIDDFHLSIDGLQHTFADTGDVEELGDIITAGHYFTGVKEINHGINMAGLKNAIAKNAGSIGVTLGTTTLSGVLIGVLSLPVTWPVFTLAAAVSVIVGTITGKAIIGKVSDGDAVVEYKRQFKEAVSELFKEMRRTSDIGIKSKRQIDEAFGALRDKINTDTEIIIKDTESTLFTLLQRVVQNRTITEQETDMLDNISKNVADIIGKATSLNKRLTSINKI